MLNIGIIGAGRIGKVHAESIANYVKNAKVTAIADPFLTPLTEEWALSMGITNCYKDHKKIIEDSSIDAVLICSSTDTHSPISIEAINAGKHVFCEKPIDHDIAKIQQVKDALEGKNLKYQVGFNRRFDRNFMALREKVVNGEIGDVHIVKITSRDPEPPNPAYIAVSGGMFLDMTIHDFDMARYLTGAEVEEVYVQSAVLVDPEIGKAGDVDTAIISLKMSNGALCVIDNSRKAVYGYDQRAEVFGSGGMAAIENETPALIHSFNKDGENAPKPLFFFLERYMQAYALEVTQFVNAVVTDSEVSVNQEDGLQEVLIGLAAKKSVEEKRPVKLSEI